jgi:GTPase SAR1 family protein
MFTRTSAIMQAHQAPLIFWDLGGQAGLRSIWDKYYTESHAILYVVDSSTASTLHTSSCIAHARRQRMCEADRQNGFLW